MEDYLAQLPPAAALTFKARARAARAAPGRGAHRLRAALAPAIGFSRPLRRTAAPRARG